MLESTSDRLDYANYDIFVGCYPNDEATQFEVARAAFDRPHIHRVVCPNPGPTSKADCLNWVVEAIKLNELGNRQALRDLRACTTLKTSSIRLRSRSTTVSSLSTT